MLVNKSLYQQENSKMIFLELMGRWKLFIATEKYGDAYLKAIKAIFGN